MTTAEAIRILGDPESNRDSVMKHYRESAKKYHPDKPTGDLDMMILVNIALEVLQSIQFTWATTDEQPQSQPLTDTIQNLWEQVKHYPGIRGEIIGTWLWVTGNTYSIMEKLHGLGFHYSHSKRSWYYHDGIYHKHNNKCYTMDDIRNLWGQQPLEEEETEAITA